ncbi:MAG: hypothetical protein JWO24_2687 [Rhodospirillales bacterium]|nr:hypothetical protein [Rhodospirillales bacterium]
MLLLATPPAAAAWTVYCVNGRTTVDSRSQAVLQVERGTACPLSRAYSSPAEAQSDARARLGGIGAFCSCR